MSDQKIETRIMTERTVKAGGKSFRLRTTGTGSFLRLSITPMAGGDTVYLGGTALRALYRLLNAGFCERGAE